MPALSPTVFRGPKEPDFQAWKLREIPITLGAQGPALREESAQLSPVLLQEIFINLKMRHSLPGSSTWAEVIPARP